MSISRQSSPAFADRIFHDYDEFAQARRGWDLQVMQLDHGKFEASLTFIPGEQGTYNRITYNRSIHHQVRSPVGNLWTFALQASHRTYIRWKGRAIPPYSISIFPPGHAFEAVSSPGTTIILYTLPQQHIESLCALYSFSSLPEKIQEASLLRCQPDQWLDTLQSIDFFHENFVNSSAENRLSRHRDALDILLPCSLLRCMDRGKNVPQQPLPRKSNAAFIQAMEMITSSADDLLTVAKLCKITGVSSKTLETAFKARLGITPKAYIRAYRLNRVRADLKRADPSQALISDVANQWGFWHMGQFAADYKKMFCELPSSTLHNRPYK